MHVVHVLQTVCAVSTCSSLHYRRSKAGGRWSMEIRIFRLCPGVTPATTSNLLFPNIPSTHARITKTTPWSILLRPNLVVHVTVKPRARPISSHPIVLKTPNSSALALGSTCHLDHISTAFYCSTVLPLHHSPFLYLVYIYPSKSLS